VRDKRQLFPSNKLKFKKKPMRAGAELFNEAYSAKFYKPKRILERITAL